MLTFLRPIITWILLHSFYFGGIVTGISSIFFKAEFGLYLSVALIPLPNLWYKLYEFPFGKDVIDFLIISVLIGIFVNKKGFVKSQSSILLMVFILLSYVSVWNVSMNFSLPIPITTDNPTLKMWKAYCVMILLYFLSLNAIEDEKRQKILVILMVGVVLLISIKSNRDFIAGSSFVDESRDPGPFWIVGLGSNHFGAFISYCFSFILGLFFLDKDKKRRLLYMATLALSFHPLFFSYSRGAYAAIFCTLAFYGLIRKRALLIAVVMVVLLWESVLPVTVVERIKMTETASGEIESSAAARFRLWEEARSMFNQYPVFGSGFNGFTLAHKGEHWSDTHNFYVKTLCEQGIIGSILLALVLLAAFRSGWKLFKNGKSNFQKGIGFGFLGCLISQVVVNMFGDRWSYYEMGSYFWVIWGLVDRGLIISENARLVKEEQIINEILPSEQRTDLFQTFSS